MTASCAVEAGSTERVTAALRIVTPFAKTTATVTSASAFVVQQDRTNEGCATSFTEIKAKIIVISYIE